MTVATLHAFLPELVLLLGALGLFVVCLGEGRGRRARIIASGVALLAVGASAVSLGQSGVLFDGTYRVDAFSQLLKLVLAFGYLLVMLVSRRLPAIRGEIQPEYYLLLDLSVSGLVMLVSCVDLITLVVALELAAFPLYLMVPMRLEAHGQKSQMEGAIKYVMFGIAANGVMLFGMSYLFGLTGTTSLPLLFPRLQPLMHSPLALVGLAMTFCGLYYKLAVFPFHFWTPDVYQGAANETASLIASLPKIGAVAVLIRLVSLSAPDNPPLVLFMSVLACASMFYGNLIALQQTDFKRLLGFSGIAHAGYALIGFVTLDRAGYSAALYYIVGYAFMVLACFTVICHVAPDGENLALEELGGLHRRSPLLALTLLVGVFALAGIPPFVGFMGKFNLLVVALGRGHLWLVIIAMVNAAIGVYYYLSVVREACLREAPERAPIVLPWSSRLLCVLLIAAIVVLGVAPGRFLDSVATSVACVNAAPSMAPAALVAGGAR